MSEVTRLLNEACDSDDPNARKALLEVVYSELRGLAQAKMAGEKAGHTLQPTILAHDAWLKLFPEGRNVRFSSRAHFFVTAAKVMRQILVDHARGRRAQKRGGQLRRTQFSTEQFGKIEHKASDELIEAVHEALKEIATNDPESVRIVEMRFYLDMSMPEVAEMLGISLSSAERMYRNFKKKFANKLRPLA